MTPHGCSLTFLRFLLRDGPLCRAIRIRQTSDVFGAFADSRKVSFKVNPFFIGNLVFFVPVTYRYSCYLYNPDHVFGERFSSFMSSQAKKGGVSHCYVLQRAECSVFNRLRASNKNKYWVHLQSIFVTVPPRNTYSSISTHMTFLQPNAMACCGHLMTRLLHE